jgi:hypothetical protein
MLDVKAAAQKASEYFASLYSERGIVSDVRLEEVELTEDGEYWLITLSYPAPDRHEILPRPAREYKQFKIASGTGEVKSMKIRKV